jgi:hypothetical protein
MPPAAAEFLLEPGAASLNQLAVWPITEKGLPALTPVPMPPGGGLFNPSERGARREDSRRAPT